MTENERYAWLRRLWRRPSMSRSAILEALGRDIEAANAPAAARPERRFSDADLQRMVAATASVGIGLGRVHPPSLVPEATSFLGGLPHLPTRLEWPREKGTGRPLIHIAEIDCETLPTVDASMPSKGTLFFFASQDPYSAANDGAVLYNSTPIDTRDERRPPGIEELWWEAPWHVDESGSRVQPSGLDNGRMLLQPLPKWPLISKGIQTYSADWNTDISIEEERFPDAVEAKELDASDTLSKVRFLSSEWPALSAAYDALTYDAWIDAFGESIVRGGKREVRQPVWRRDDDFPFVWSVLQGTALSLERSFVLIRDLSPKGQIGPAVSERLSAAVLGAEAWRRRAETKWALESVAPDDRLAFIEFLESECALEIGNVTKEERKLQLSNAIEREIGEHLDLLIWREEFAGATIGQETLALLQQRGAPLILTRNWSAGEELRPDKVTFSVLHRLLGCAPRFESQWEADRLKGLILLAEFSHDFGARLSIGDWKLQYWIPPEDLAAHDFSRAVLARPR